MELRLSSGPYREKLGPKAFVAAEDGSKRARRPVQRFDADAIAPTPAARAAQKYTAYTKLFKENARIMPRKALLFKGLDGKYQPPEIGSYLDFQEVCGDYVVVKDRGDALQYSAFACKYCSTGTLLGPCGGEMVNVPEDEEENDDVTIELIPESDWVVRMDATAENEDFYLYPGAFVNDPFGVMQQDNWHASANAEVVIMGKLVSGVPTIMPFVRAIRPIDEGEEIFFSYGQDYWKATVDTRARRTQVIEHKQYLPRMRYNTETGLLEKA